MHLRDVEPQSFILPHWQIYWRLHCRHTKIKKIQEVLERFRHHKDQDFHPATPVQNDGSWTREGFLCSDEQIQYRLEHGTPDLQVRLEQCLRKFVLFLPGWHKIQNRTLPEIRLEWIRWKNFWSTLCQAERIWACSIHSLENEGPSKEVRSIQ